MIVSYILHLWVFIYFPSLSLIPKSAKDTCTILASHVFAGRRCHRLVVVHLNVQSTASSEKSVNEVQSAQFYRFHHGRDPGVHAVHLAKR